VSLCASYYAVTKIQTHEQDNYKHTAANNLMQLITNKHNNRKSKGEWKTITSIIDKINSYNLIITQADKGKTIVIIEQHKYKQYVQEFINNNDCINLQTESRKTTPKNNYEHHKVTLTNKQNKHKYTNTNPNARNLRSTIKTHKKPDRH
jgi:hypothetical protein